MRGAMRTAGTKFLSRRKVSARVLFGNVVAPVKRPLIRPSATFSPTKSVGEKALD
jgi:hypothetical protein